MSALLLMKPTTALINNITIIINNCIYDMQICSTCPLQICSCCFLKKKLVFQRETLCTLLGLFVHASLLHRAFLFFIDQLYLIAARCRCRFLG
jgi:hypothetical protein